MSGDRKNHLNSQLSDLEKQKIFEKTDFPIKEKEVSQAIKTLKSKKATVLDQISNEMIRYSQHLLLPHLTRIFNLILNSGYYPQSWQESFIVPIHKAGNPLDPSNYRGITILSCLGKLFQTVMNIRLTQYLTEHSKIREEQIGFKQGSRTADHMFSLKTLIDKYNRNHKKLYTCFVDFKKAFDTVDHIGLLYKLKRCGIGDLMYNVIKDRYTGLGDRTCVKIGNNLTETFKSKVWVKQEDPMSATLFNIYINDVVRYFDDTCKPVFLGDTPINCLLYADDLIILSETKEGLQNAMNKLAIFCQEWALEVNINKSKVLVFTANGRKEVAGIQYRELTLETVSSYKYLGIIFTTSGQFTAAKEDLYKRGLKASFKLANLITV
jgi:hypothetical protein